MVGRRLFVAAAITVIAAPLAAQDVTLQGQIRPRHELRDPASPGLKEFTSMRVRASITAALENDVTVFIELQDVRIFGEETSTLGDFSADNFDLHQGYADLGSFTEGDWMIRAGRQEVNLGGQRLVGPVGWTQQGRSFDGARVRTRGRWGVVDFMAFKTRELGAGEDVEDSEFFGAYATVSTGDLGGVDLFGFYQVGDGPAETDQGTFGFRWAGRSSGWSYRAESAFQTGTRADRDVSAFMFGGRLGRDFADSRANVTLWYDFLSGDDSPNDGETKVFDTMFATNHKFYGLADLFLNIPAHTAGLGLQDFAVKGGMEVTDDLRLDAELHSFRLSEQGFASGTHLGEEVDLTGSLRYSQNATIQVGVSYIAQDDAFAEIGRLEEDMWWGYLMLNVMF